MNRSLSRCLLVIAFCCQFISPLAHAHLAHEVSGEPQGIHAHIYVSVDAAFHHASFVSPIVMADQGVVADEQNHHVKVKKSFTSPAKYPGLVASRSKAVLPAFDPLSRYLISYYLPARGPPLL